MKTNFLNLGKLGHKKFGRESELYSIEWQCEKGVGICTISVTRSVQS